MEQTVTVTLMEEGAGVKEARETATPTIIYTPRILRNLAEICEAFGVGEKTVKAWVKQGAPIAVEGDGRRVRYSAEVVELQAWRRISM